MIQLQTILRVIDNSGAVFVKCIKLSKRRRGSVVGDVITVVIKKSFIKKKVKKSKEVKTGQICQAVIVRAKSWIKRWGSFYIRSYSNCAVLINKTYVPFGSRLSGPIFREIRTNINYSKVMALAYLSF